MKRMIPIAGNVANTFALILFVLLVCLVLTHSGKGQETIISPNSNSWIENIWPNPYPGLGNVSPSPVNPFASLSQTKTLYADQTLHDAGTFSPVSTHSVRPVETYLGSASDLPSGKRTGFFQKISSNTLWVPAEGSQPLGVTEFDLSVTFGLPLPTPQSPLLLTPRFSTTALDTKDEFKETFYTTGLALRWLRPVVQDKFMLDVGASILYSGDFQESSSSAMRYPVHVAAIWFINPRIKAVLGAAYTDRRYFDTVIPVGGIIWTPTEDINVELIIPRLKIAQRIRWFGSAAGTEQSDWLYTALEFATSTWSSQDIAGRVESRDLRVLLGYERRTRFGINLGIEGGYMFDREIRNFGNRYPSDSAFIRLRTSF